MDYVPAGEWRALSWRTPSWIGQTSECWIHHGARGQPTLATLRSYERYHVRTLGWYALGYSWAVTADEIYEGRGWHRAGAHTRGRNGISHAVLLVGDWSHRDVPAEMVAMAAEVIRDGIDRGALTADVTIGGHREAPGQSTQCPGAGGMRAVPRVRKLVEEDPMAKLDQDDYEAIARAVWRELLDDRVTGEAKYAATLLTRIAANTEPE